MELRCILPHKAQSTLFSKDVKYSIMKEQSTDRPSVAG